MTLGTKAYINSQFYNYLLFEIFNLNFVKKWLRWFSYVDYHLSVARDQFQWQNVYGNTTLNPILLKMAILAVMISSFLYANPYDSVIG